MLLKLVSLFLPATCVSAQSNQLDLSFGWTYSASDQGDSHATINGYYADLNWNVRRNAALTVSQATQWGSYRQSALTQRVYLGGYTQYLRRDDVAIRPFIQPLGGVTRVSYLETIEHQPTIQVCAGAEIRLAQRLSLEVTPIGYSWNHASTGPLHNFVAGFGLSIPLLKARERSY